MRPAASAAVGACSKQNAPRARRSPADGPPWKLRRRSEGGGFPAACSCALPGTAALFPEGGRFIGNFRFYAELFFRAQLRAIVVEAVGRFGPETCGGQHESLLLFSGVIGRGGRSPASAGSGGRMTGPCRLPGRGRTMKKARAMRSLLPRLSGRAVVPAFPAGRAGFPVRYSGVSVQPARCRSASRVGKLWEKVYSNENIMSRCIYSYEITERCR